MISYQSLLNIIKVRNKMFRVYSSAPIQEKSIKLDKWNINYIKVGEGPHHVLCLPGALGTIWTDFKPQIEGFDRGKFTLVVWDPPGYGKSRPPDKEFTGNFYKKDADHAFQFMRALKIPKYSVIGWSGGGVAALIHAAKYSDATIKLVAIAAGSRILLDMLTAITQLRDIITWSQSRRKVMTEIYGETWPEYWDRLVEGHKAIYHGGGDMCAHLLKDVKCPTLVIYGGKDNLSPPMYSTDIVKNIPGSRSHVYPEGGHNIHLKYAEDFNKRVQDFLLET